jgi:hypothetical protein
MNDDVSRDKDDSATERKGQPWFDYFIVLAILALGIFVVLQPGAIYAPVPRVVLFTLIGILTSLVLGRQVQAKLDLKGPGFSMVVAGSAALVFISLLLLTRLSRPELMVSVFQVYTESGDEVPLDGEDMFQAKIAATGLSVTSIVQGNTMVLIFPEQQPRVDVRVRYGNTSYFGTLSYIGARESELVLGTHLKPKGQP